MLSLIRRKQHTDRLIWDYLDGEISPSRAGRLSSLLSERPAVRRQLAESAAMHGMLYAYFRDRQSGEQIGAEPQAQPRRKRRRAGRSSAA